MTSDPAQIVEAQDAIDHLGRNGFAELLDVLRDQKCYTQQGRVIIARVARKLRVSPRRVAELLDQARLSLQ